MTKKRYVQINMSRLWLFNGDPLVSDPLALPETRLFPSAASAWVSELFPFSACAASSTARPKIPFSFTFTADYHKVRIGSFSAKGLPLGSWAGGRHTRPPRDSVPDPRELTGLACDGQLPTVQPAVAKRDAPVVPTELPGAPTVDRSKSYLQTIADPCAQEGTGG